MFNSVETFKKQFEKRIIEKYGRCIEESHISERYDILGTMIRDYASMEWKNCKEEVNHRQLKKVIYFSMEFLIGRLMSNNLNNLGVYAIAKQGLEELGFDIHELENQESDAGLGNGGLGRLAACFLDSMASLGYPIQGNSIRYEYGFFRQKIENQHQIELPDQWLKLGNVWEIRKPKHAVDVRYYGSVQTSCDKNGKLTFNHLNTESVKAIPYDVPVIGYGGKTIDTLRLWSAEPSNEELPKNKDFYEYLSETRKLCHGLYPDDSTESGKLLRLKQQYFFVSAGIQSHIKAHLRVYSTLDNLSDKVTFQLNDTHPVLAIPELMRILMDEYHYEWEDAWNIVTKSVAYTNHTVMSEALEKWPIFYLQTLLPRIYMIIEEMNRRFVAFVRQTTNNENLVRSMSIIKDGMVYMANLAIVGSFSINGVAYLHTQILKNDVFKDFYSLFPEKFNNKTNGITHRRWLMYSNPQLTKLICNKIGSDWFSKPQQLEQLMSFVEDKEMQKAFLEIKKERKQILANYLLNHNDIKVNVDSIFDIQVKRLHAYKRQLLNVFHIIYFYQRLKTDPSFKPFPRTFIFGAKAAPSYVFAKKIIELILTIAHKINLDSKISSYIQVVFVENYDVSKAEIIMPSADVSEQISTAGKEASGTGNMKFMMNGALTLGTLDGANVEISEHVGMENCIIFGLKEFEITAIRNSGTYNPWDYYRNDSRLKNVLDSLVDGTFGEIEAYRMIFNEVMLRNDEYFLLADFASYVQAQEKVEEYYRDESLWSKICLTNIAKSGYFSSDRTIEEYVREIWKSEKLKNEF